MKEIYYPTKTERDIYEILRNFHSMTQEQITTLFERQGRTPTQIDMALHNLWVHGKIYHERDGRLWKSNQMSDRDMDTLGCVNLMLKCTETVEDELIIYKTALFGTGDYNIAFICEDLMYYIVFLMNDAAALHLRLFQEKLNQQGDVESRNKVRLILVAPDERIFDRVDDLSYPAMFIVMNRMGYETEFKTV